MDKIKKVPIRKCAGCNAHKEKKSLIRIVNNKTDGIFIDYTGKANGRGVYICNDINCFEKAVKTNRLNNSLGIKIDDQIIEELKRKIMIFLRKQSVKE